MVRKTTQKTCNYFIPSLFETQLAIPELLIPNVATNSYFYEVVL